MAWSLVIPLGLLLAAYFAIPPLQQMPERLQFLVQYLPHGAAMIALLMAVLLNQARILCIALLLMIGYELLALVAASPAEDAWRITAVFCAYSVLLPLNLALISWFRERGLYNGHGVFLLALIAGQAGLVVWFLREQPVDIVTPLAQPFLPIHTVGPIPDVGLVVLVLTLAVLAWRFQDQPSTLNASLLSLPPVLAAAAYWHASPAVPQALIAAAALTLALGLVLDVQRIAYRDDLTGLPGRRALNLYLSAPGRRYTIAMLDVDHFKKFNDTYGHDVGDEVLRMVASQLQRVGGGGKVFRYGGEEFTIVFRGRDMADARAHLDAVRQRIGDYELVVRNPSRPRRKPSVGQKQRGHKKDNITTNVTISIGLASRGSEQKRPEEVMKAADQALYRAKKAGRNGIMPAAGRGS